MLHWQSSVSNKGALLSQISPKTFSETENWTNDISKHFITSCSEDGANYQMSTNRNDTKHAPVKKSTHIKTTLKGCSGGITQCTLGQNEATNIEFGSTPGMYVHWV